MENHLSPSHLRSSQFSCSSRILQKYGFDFADGVYGANLKELRSAALNVHNLDWSVSKAFQFLEESRDEPFFLFFSTTLHHGPAPWANQFSLEADQLYDLKNDPEENDNVFDQDRKVAQRMQTELAKALQQFEGRPFGEFTD